MGQRLHSTSQANHCIWSASATSLKSKHTFGGNEVPEMRKERIPDEFVTSFAEAVTLLDDGPSAIAEICCRVEGEGIGGMYEFLTRKLGHPGAATLPGPTTDCMRALLDRLEAEYDFVDLRFGERDCY